jgi:flagellar biosynthetic protein FlhB
MADQDNRTEQPTARRLEKAREKGQIPQSQELGSAATLVCLLGAAVLAGPWFVEWADEKVREGVSCRTEALSSLPAFTAFMHERIVESMMIMAPFLLALTVGGTAAAILMGGLNFTPSALAPKLDQLNPVSGFKKLFSVESLVKLGLSVLKLIFIAVIVWIYLEDKMESLALLQWLEAGELLAAMGKLILGVTIRISLAIAVIALADVIYQKWQYIRRLKMTRQEVRDEHRDTEGPPEIRSKVRQKQFEAAMRRMLQEVPKANVVLVNPDHVAVAIRYEPKKMAAPVVVAKGGDHMCEKIKEIARSYGVPILRRPPLARELYARVKLGHPIPESLYTAVAEVLALIYRLRRSS